MHLPDINVWLALTFSSQVHHTSARSWFEGLAENGGCYFCRFTQQTRFSPNTWSDAYLAAFAQVAGMEIVTFDQGFTQYQGVLSTILP